MPGGSGHHGPDHSLAGQSKTTRNTYAKEDHGGNKLQRLVMHISEAEASCGVFPEACLPEQRARLQASVQMQDRILLQSSRKVYQSASRQNKMLSTLGTWQHCVLSGAVILSYLLPSEARPQQSDLFKQIERDLRNFSDGISMDMVEQVYCSNTDQGVGCCVCVTFACALPPVTGCARFVGFQGSDYKLLTTDCILLVK